MLAMANGTRDVVRLLEWSAPNEESISPAVRRAAPPAPSRRTSTSPATEEVAGMFATVSGLRT